MSASEAVLARFAPPPDADADTFEGAAWIAQLVGDLNAALPKFASFEQWAAR